MTDWLTSRDIAEQTGLKLDTIYTYRQRKTLPEPDYTIGRTPLWKQSTIDEWNSSRSTIELEANQ
jgi:predicted DNA-binding transcriptional regulator AlpA